MSQPIIEEAWEPDLASDMIRNLKKQLNDTIALCEQWQRLAEGWEELYRMSRQ